VFTVAGGRGRWEKMNISGQKYGRSLVGSVQKSIGITMEVEGIKRVDAASVEKRGDIRQKIGQREGRGSDG